MSDCRKLKLSYHNFQPLTAEEEQEMGEKVLLECEYPDKKQLLDVLQQIFEAAESPKKSENYFATRYPASKLWFQLCQQTTNRYNHQVNLIGEKITTLKNTMRTLSRIRQLSNTRQDVSIEELNSELDDVDLTLLMQKRHLNEDVLALDQIYIKNDSIEKECNEIETQILQTQSKIDAIMDVSNFFFIFYIYKNLSGTRKRIPSSSGEDFAVYFNRL